MTVALIIVAVLLGCALLAALPDWLVLVIVLGWMVYGIGSFLNDAGSGTKPAPGSVVSGGTDDCGDWRFDQAADC